MSSVSVPTVWLHGGKPPSDCFWTPEQFFKFMVLHGYEMTRSGRAVSLKGRDSRATMNKFRDQYTACKQTFCLFCAQLGEAE